MSINRIFGVVFVCRCCRELSRN